MPAVMSSIAPSAVSHDSEKRNINQKGGKQQRPGRAGLLTSFIWGIFETNLIQWHAAPEQAGERKTKNPM